MLVARHGARDCAPCSTNPLHKDGGMMDVGMIAVCVVFFGVTMAMVWLADRT